MADDINVIINNLPNGTISFVGDGAILHKKLLNGSFTLDSNIHAANVGICGFKKFIDNNIETPDSANPMYLRKSQAERMKYLK